MDYGSESFQLIYLFALIAALCLQGVQSVECLDCADRRTKCNITGYFSETKNKIEEQGGDGTFNGTDLSECLPPHYKIVNMDENLQCFWSKEKGCTAVILYRKNKMPVKSYCLTCDDLCEKACPYDAADTVSTFAWTTLMILGVALKWAF